MDKSELEPLVDMDKLEVDMDILMLMVKDVKCKLFNKPMLK